jgi:hypothetical protein
MIHSIKPDKRYIQSYKPVHLKTVQKQPSHPQYYYVVWLIEFLMSIILKHQTNDCLFKLICPIQVKTELIVPALIVKACPREWRSLYIHTYQSPVNNNSKTNI